MSKWIDFLRGGNWRGDSQKPEPETFDAPETEEMEMDEVESTIEAIFAHADERLDEAMLRAEYANGDFRQRLKELRELAGALDGEPLVEEEHEALVRRIEEREQTLASKTDALIEALKKYTEEVAEITGEDYEFDFDDDDDDVVEPPEDEENENFADLHGLDPNAEPEDVLED